MARGKKEYPDDDGRTVFDMSQVSRPGTWTAHPRPPKVKEEGEKPRREYVPMDREDRRIYVFAALRAALLIALVFIVGFGAAIWLLIALWS